MSENQSRFVLLCQQALAFAVVVVVAAPAVGVGTLDLVAPEADGSGAAASRGPGADAPDWLQRSVVATAAVQPTVTAVPLTGPGNGAATGATTGSALMARSVASVTADPEGTTQPDRTPAGVAGATSPTSVTSVPQPVDGYATVGVTWSTGERLDDDEITVSVRSLDHGAWSQWQDLPYDADHGPQPGSPEAERQRFGTDALVVGDVDDVQVRAVTSKEALPDRMSLDIVDPGEETEVAEEGPEIDTSHLSPTGLSRVAATTTGTPANVTPKPKIYSRAQWGADERMRDGGSLRYFEVHAGFVHHTVNANSYTREQVPSILRGIYAYHTQSRGWSDVGYNFLVDRFGRIWEGRYGGVARPVVGAHTLGYNDYAFAISAIGNFETARPGSALLDAYARLMAWKLSLHGVAARSMRQPVGDLTTPAVNGHRDVGQTACPGRYLYAQMDVIRRRAIAYQRPFSARQKDTNISGSRWPDLVVRDADSQAVSIVRTGGQIGFESARVAAPGWGGVDLHATSGDLTGDGVADVVARDASTKVTSVWRGTGTGTFTGPVRSTRQFASMDRLLAPGDLNGDGKADLVARNRETTRLLLFPGTGGGRFGQPRSLAPRWAYGLTAAGGDLDRDGNPDLLARDATGRLWLHPGNGRGSLRSRVAVAGRWGGFDQVSALGDLTRDGRPDILARSRATGGTWLYPGNARGGLGRRLGPYTQFANVDLLSSPGQVTGSRAADLVGRGPSGRLVVFTHKGTRNVASIVPTGATFGNTDLILSVGDWNGDGRNDVLTRRQSDGAMLFRAGAPGNRFAAPVLTGTRWGSVRLVTAVGDLTGDGYPDVMGQPRGGNLRVYPSNGRAGFARSLVARGAVTSTRQVGAGLWNRDGSPDSIFRRSDGSLWVYPGNGPGGLTGGRQIGSQGNRYDWIIGAGDVNGRGRTDLVARHKTTGELWLLPGVNGSFGTRRLIAPGFGRYDLVG